MKQKYGAATLILILVIIVSASLSASDPKDATDTTRNVNRDFARAFDWADRQDFEDATRGLIDEGTMTIGSSWNLEQYSFLKGDPSCPDTVNPGLWRHARTNYIHGLFKVTDHIYQVRGYDLSCISFIEGETGYIVIDPLVCAETAQAALGLLYRNIGKKPVVAVIYTHSHIDHWAGVKGVLSDAAVASGKARVLAPQGFMEEAVSENVFAGNAMTRRAMYMYGNLIPKGPRGQVDAGLGPTVSWGTITLIPPTDIIHKTGETRTIDGVTIVFQYTPNTEAPTEMNLYFPQYKAICIAENCVHTMHNLYTLRGAKVRDAKSWALYLNETIDLFGGEAEVMFASHHWPQWGNSRIVSMIRNQRDAYKYIHDQTLHLANEGYTMIEIAERLRLPDKLARAWYNRGYYGTVNHNIKAVYQHYLGWFDGNPATLHPLPPVEAARKYVEYMGGAGAVIKKARNDYGNGEYRWVAEAMKHVVFADPGNREARELEADALEQLGYQAESAVWRNFYLTGARELREGVRKMPGKIMSSDVLGAMPLGLIFDYMAIRLNGPKAANKSITINWNITDTGEKYLMTVENGVLNYFKNKQSPKANATVTTKRTVLNTVFAGESTFKARVASGDIKLKGNILKLAELMSIQNDFDPNFKIMER